MASPPKLRRISVQDAVDAYLDLARVQIEVGQLQPTTVATYTRDLHELIRIGGATTILDDLQGPDIDRIVLEYGRDDDHRYTKGVKQGRGRSLATQARFRQSVSRFFNHAVIHGWVQANPMLTATIRPRLRGTELRSSRKALPLPQARALLDHGPSQLVTESPNGRKPRADQQLGTRDRAILWLLVALGPRVSELCNANRGDLYVQDDVTYWVITGKGGKTRRVPVPAAVVEFVEEYQGSARPSPGPAMSEAAREDAAKALFLTFTGRRITPRDVQNLVKRSVAKVPPALRRDVTPHGLRHTAATVLISEGEDPSVVQRLLGHADLSTTGQYRDQLPGELERLAAHHPVLRQAPAAEAAE